MLGRLVAYPAGSAPAPAEEKRFNRSKMGALLGWLAYHLEQDHARDVLADRLWPAADTDAAKHCLNQALYKLRQEFGLDEPGAQPMILGSHLHVRLNRDLLRTDVQDFRALLRRAELAAVPSGPPHRRDERIDLLSQAVELYRGELLPGYYEEWVLIERERLALQFVDAVVGLLDLLAEARDFERAMQTGLRAAAVIPCHEDLSIALMGLYQKLDKPIDGLREYVRLCSALRRYEGRDPGANATAMVSALKRQALALGLRPPHPRSRRSAKGAKSAKSAEVAGAGGRQREAAGSGRDPSVAAPPVSPVSPAPRRETASRNPWPQWRARFIGREDDLERLTRMLSSVLGVGPETGGEAPGAVRAEEPAKLVTVVGVAGAGKTRLVLEAADRIRAAFTGEMAYVPLAELSDPRLLVDRIAASLGLHERPAAGSIRSVVEGLGGRPALLLLDNIEHLLPAAADIILELLESSPRLVCLCTSREPLGLEAEQLFPLLPLATPRPEAPLSSIGESAAVRLFVDRARLVRPEFQLTERNGAVVAALCRRVEGIPLAIELAAARYNVLTPLQMLERMADRFGLLVAPRSRTAGRHQTLRDAVAWSYDLLGPEAKQVFIQLSVFSGGWSLEAAESICRVSPQAFGAPGPSDAPEPAGMVVLDHLQQLVDRSLVQFTEVGGAGRYTMLQTLRDFACELCTPASDSDPRPDSSAPTLRAVREAARARHARFYGEMAVEAESALRGSGATERYALLSLEDENLDSALDWMEWMIGTGGPRLQPQMAMMPLRAVAALWRYWYWRGSTGKGGERLRAALALPEGAGGPEDRGAELLARGKAWLGLAALARLSGDYGRAGQEMQRAERACDTLRDVLPREEYCSFRGDVCQQRAILCDEQGQVAEAVEWQQEALELFQLLEDVRGVATSYGNLGRIRQKSGALDESRRCYERALNAYDQLGDTLQCAAVWNNIGSIAYETEDYLGAKLAFETSCTLFRAIGNVTAAAMPHCNYGDTLARLGALDEARATLAEGLDMLRQTGDEIGQGYVLISLGTIAARQGDHARGVSLLTAGRAVLQRRSAPLSQESARGLERDLADCRDHLSDKEWSAATAFGASLPLNSAIQLALNQVARKDRPANPYEAGAALHSLHYQALGVTP
jgi:predicted ATPase/DNA-binding SARP family transcriptional activator